MGMMPFLLQLVEQRWHPSNDETSSVHKLLPTFLLWLLIAAAYLITSTLLCNRMLHAKRNNHTWWSLILGFGLGSTAFIFKLASTADHSPELLPSTSATFRDSLLQIDCVMIARTLFVTLAAIMSYVLFFSGKLTQQGTEINFTKGLDVFADSLCRQARGAVRNNRAVPDDTIARIKCSNYLTVYVST